MLATAARPTPLAIEHARAVQRSADLLGGSADLISLGIVSARGSAAARRALADTAFDDIDQEALADLANVIRSTAETIEFFATRGRGGVQPSEGSSGRIDVILEAVVGEEGAATDPQELSTKLDVLADSIETFIGTPEDQTAEILLHVFSALTEAVKRDTSAVGESTSVL